MNAAIWASISAEAIAFTISSMDSISPGLCHLSVGKNLTSDRLLRRLVSRPLSSAARDAALRRQAGVALDHGVLHFDRRSARRRRRCGTGLVTLARKPEKALAPPLLRGRRP